MMCNIVTFRFTCQHTLRRRRSRCGGTKHKTTVNSTKAACVAESFLTIYLRIDCDPCQHRAWETAWKLKLERANTFLDKLRQRSLSGVDEICVLVKSLEAEYATASWDTRNVFAHAPRPSVTRVKHNFYEKTASKLPQEILPEDVIDKAEKAWGELEEDDYDGNYVASTDPVHPVSTDYSHPWDDDDGDWILQHLSPEDVDPGFDDTIDLHNHSWSWGDGDDNPKIGTQANTWDQEQAGFEEDTRAMSDSTNVNSGLVAWGPDVNETSTAELNAKGLSPDKAERKAGVEAVVTAFWSIVKPEKHGTTNQLPEQSSLQDNNTLTALLHDLAISNVDTDPPTPTTPTKPPRQPLWTNGTCDSPPPPSPRPATPPSPNSTRSWYDKQRRFLKLRKEVDVKKYYVDWLYISRCEIRDFEGPEGRIVREPVKVRR